MERFHQFESSSHNKINTLIKIIEWFNMHVSTLSMSSFHSVKNLSRAFPLRSKATLFQLNQSQFPYFFIPPLIGPSPLPSLSYGPPVKNLLGFFFSSYFYAFDPSKWPSFWAEFNATSFSLRCSLYPSDRFVTYPSTASFYLFLLSLSHTLLHRIY